MNQYLIDKLKEGRLAKGYKQSDVTELIGIKKNTISNYENGVTEPDIDTYLELCRIYDLDYADILETAYNLKSYEEFQISSVEKTHIKKYRTLSENDKKAVDNLIDTLCNKPPFGYSERLKSFTNVDGARAYLKEHNDLTPAFSDKELTDDDICEIATRRYNK